MRERFALSLAAAALAACGEPLDTSLPANLDGDVLASDAGDGGRIPDAPPGADAGGDAGVNGCQVQVGEAFTTGDWSSAWDFSGDSRARSTVVEGLARFNAVAPFTSGSYRIATKPSCDFHLTFRLRHSALAPSDRLTVFNLTRAGGDDVRLELDGFQGFRFAMRSTQFGDTVSTEPDRFVDIAVDVLLDGSVNAMIGSKMLRTGSKQTTSVEAMTIGLIDGSVETSFTLDVDDIVIR